LFLLPATRTLPPAVRYLFAMDDSERERDLQRNQTRLTDLRGYL
jgi:hypothetical protein